MKPLKIAMMGMTHGHTRKYYQVLKENPKLDWVAVSTTDDFARQLFLKAVQGVPCYGSDVEMLDAHPEIEAVVIASANKEHLGQMKLCAERGINILEAGHFFTEQPVTQIFADLLLRLDPDMYVEIADSNLIRLI